MVVASSLTRMVIAHASLAHSHAGSRGNIVSTGETPRGPIVRRGGWGAGGARVGKYGRYAGFGSDRAQASLHVRRSGAADPDRRPAFGNADADRHLPRNPHPGDRRRLAVHRPAARRDVGPRHAAASSVRSPPPSTTSSISRRTSYTGVGIVKVFFQPGTDIRTANAQVTAISQTVLRQMPPNITPPLILNYNASTVPIIQLALAGKGMSEQAVFDIAINTVRTPLVTVPGAAIPFPFGGKFRQIQIDLDPAALQARGLSANDVANALAAQNLLDAGRARRRSAASSTPSSSTTRRATSRRWPTCRSSRPTAPWSTCATSPRCATATRRRPTSCMSTAAARCCCRC